MSILNGSNGTPIDGWTIVLFGERNLIGAMEDAEVDTLAGQKRVLRLNPGYELQVQIGQTPRGLAVAYLITPILMFSSLRAVQVPPGAVAIPVMDLSPKERKNLAEVARRCEEMLSAMRAQDAGIRLAKTLPEGGRHVVPGVIE